MKEEGLEDQKIVIVVRDGPGDTVGFVMRSYQMSPDQVILALEKALGMAREGPDSSYEDEFELEIEYDNVAQISLASSASRGGQ